MLCFIADEDSRGTMRTCETNAETKTNLNKHRGDAPRHVVHTCVIRVHPRNSVAARVRNSTDADSLRIFALLYTDASVQ
jgi:hypothetical protein